MAEYYLDRINQGMRLNRNPVPAKADFARYMHSARDVGSGVNRTRIDSIIWRFFTQFNVNGDFLNNGPNDRELTMSPYLNIN
jgi:hypothetical protein